RSTSRPSVTTATSGESSLSQRMESSCGPPTRSAAGSPRTAPAGTRPCAAGTPAAAPGGPPPGPGRYHLYISWACPWAHRTAIVRKLLGLQEAISLSAVDPVRDGRGWAFREGAGHSLDPVNGFSL